MLFIDGPRRRKAIGKERKIMFVNPLVFFFVVVRYHTQRDCEGCYCNHLSMVLGSGPALFEGFVVRAVAIGVGRI